MTSNALRLDFIGVGVAKAGTSWLAACLGQHPGLCMAEPKELNYFCDRAIWPRYRVNNRLGPDWLAQRFEQCRSGQRLGEFSPNYFCDERSPELIHQHNPECRLIFCLRHPVEVLVSFYHQIRRESPVSDSFEEFLRKYPSILQMGRLHFHIQRFLHLFPRGRCLFLLFEDMQQDPALALSQTYSFLGVDPDFAPAELNRRVNEAQAPRSRLLMAAIDLARRTMQKATPGPLLQRAVWKLKLHRFHDMLLRRNLQPFTPTAIAPETRAKLLREFRADIEALAAFLGRDLSRWLS
jgi:hypothetical protein